MGALRRSANLSSDGLRVAAEGRVMAHFQPLLDLLQKPEDRESIRQMVFAAMADVMVAIGDEECAPFGYEKEYEGYVRNLWVY